MVSRDPKHSAQDLRILEAGHYAVKALAKHVDKAKELQKTLRRENRQLVLELQPPSQSVFPLCRTMVEYKLAVDSSKKATELPLLRVCGTVQQNPHMRAFWASTISFFLAFLGWFALAPLGLEVATSMGTCENQLFPPTDFPTRPAYLKFKNLKSGLSYCQYGVLKEDGKPIDCQDVPADVVSSAGSAAEEKEKYRPQVLPKCVCTPGTECKSVIANAGVASVASTIFVRVALGTLLERFGPVNVQCGLMSFGAFWVAMAAAITAPWNYTLIRFFIGFRE
eukprot:s336_g1.t1